MNTSRTGTTQYRAVDVMYTLLSVINRLHEIREERTETLVRHTIWFNATMHINNFIMGLVASMEKRDSEDEDSDTNSITAAKVSLMGSLPGIDDSFSWGILRIIAARIGISLASTGSPLGAAVFLLPHDVSTFLIHHYALYSGYSIDESFIQKMYESDGMEILTGVPSMLGLMMMGDMTASDVKFKTVLETSVRGNEDVVKIQDYLDQLFTGIVPSTATLLASWLLREKVNVSMMIFGIMFLSILLGLLGIC